MELKSIKKVRDSKYLKNYELTYINKAGKEKIYEIVSHSELGTPSDIGQTNSGVSIVALKNDKLLLLREFRMGVNSYIYNLCAGFTEPGESIENCIKRELYEETGLKVKRIIKIFKPAFVAVGLSDVKNQLAIVEIESDESDITEEHTSDNEDIKAKFYTRDEVDMLLSTSDFSSRAQAVCFMFTQFDLLKQF